MIDVKKLTVGFLILAVAGGASALIISNFTGGTGGQFQTAIAENAPQMQPTNLIDGNAFVPLASTTESVILTSSTITSSTLTAEADPNNLTNILANAYMNGLIDANPSGLQTDTNGSPILTPPNADTVISQFETSSSTLANLQMPDWDAEAAAIPIVTIPISSSSTLTNYSVAIQGIFEQDFIQPNLESMLQGQDPSSAAYVEGKIESALKDVAGLQTPSSAVGFQKSLVKLLVYEKNILALTQNANVDPVKTALILQGEETNYNTAMQNLGAEIQNTPGIQGFSLGNTSETPSGDVAIINNFLGVQTAHAQWITFDPSNFGQMLLEYANNIVLQILKNVVIHLMQNTVLKWVSGNGVPRFINNWASTLVTAYTTAAVNAINQGFACINPTFVPQLKILLLAPTVNSNANNACAYQFQGNLTGNNLTNFYNNFSNGGFASYMQLFQPGGNLFGAAIDIQDSAMNAGSANQQSVQTQSIANQGWNPSGTCGDPASIYPGGQWTPNGSHWACQGNSGTTYYPKSDNNGTLTCNTGDQLVSVPNGGLCADGSQPNLTSPGQVTGQVFNSAVNSGSNLVTSANDIAGLLNAFLTSLLNSLASDAITAVNTALPAAAGGTGGGGGGAGAGGNGSQTVPTPIFCTATPNTSNPDSFSFSVSGGSVSTITSSGSTTQTTPQYTWTATGGNPTTGNGASFVTVFPGTGTYSITALDTVDNVSASCPVTIQ